MTLNISAYDYVSVQINGKTVSTHCATYHCNFDIENLKSQETALLQVKL